MERNEHRELSEQILRSGLFASLYDEKAVYGFLAYLTYRVEDTLYSWQKESDTSGFWADLTWNEYIAFFRRQKALVLAARKVMANAIMAFPASAFNFALAEEDVDFPLTLHDNSGILHMAQLYPFENGSPMVECLMLKAEQAYYLIWKERRGPCYTWELYVMELLHNRMEFVEPLTRAFRSALAQLDFLAEWQMIYPTIQHPTEEP